MKIKLKFMTRPMSLNRSNLKKTSKKKTRIRNITNMMNQISLVDTKISFLNTACGTIKCVETLSSPSKEGRIIESIPESSILKKRVKDNRPNRVKARKRNIKTKILEDKHDHANSNLKQSIVKMSTNKRHCCKSKEPTILGICSNTVKKSDESALSFLGTLIGNGAKESTIFEEANSEELIEKYKSSVVMEPRNHFTSKTYKPPQPSNTKLSNSPSNESNSPLCSISAKTNDKNSLVKFYELGSSMFLVLMHPQSSLALVGTLEIQLLKGSLEIFGYNLYKENEKVLIFSLQGSSHLSLTAKEGNFLPSDQTSCVKICEKLIALGLPELLSQNVSKKAENSILFTVARHKSDVSTTVWPQFFEHHSSFSFSINKHLFQDSSRPCHVVERKINCLFESNIQEVGLKEFVEVAEWSLIEHDVLKRDHPKVIFCGGKSVGKSSLLRFLVNKCLYKWKQILVLDFDLGQCEFTLPGCISATVVEEPLLGPNFSHLKEPVRSVYLGEVDVTKCPEKYIEGCKFLIDFADENYSDIPWLVNTMGFTKGFGVSLACGIITYTSPTHVVQIQSKDRKLNFPSLLEPQYVECLRHSAFDVALSRTDYQLYEIPSGSEQPGFVSKSRGMSPAESRNLVILSYMSRMLNSNTSSLSQVTPYMINMDKLKLLTINEYNLTKSQVAATMNGNMVALCLETPSNKFLDCRGFGIVRAVDWQNNTLFLITPLPPSELSGVNCLVKGNIGLPDSLYYNQGELVTGHVPYLAHTSAGSTARFAKRDFRSLPVTQRSYR